MADMEPFTLIQESGRPGLHQLFDDVLKLESAPTADHDFPIISALRDANPGTIVAAIPIYNVSLPAFAAAGFATCELDNTTDSFLSHRGYAAPALRQNKGHLAESVYFAKYHYKWNNEDYILYTVGGMQYVLKERRDSEHVLGPSKAIDALIQAIGDFLLSVTDVVWVYDHYWMQSKELYRQVMRMNWDKVILDEMEKKEISTVANKFFNSKSVYEDLGVPWKRGLLFHGPPGNGKTISIKALMHTLLDRKDRIPTLYVKSAPYTYDIKNVFNRARALSPCMVVLEDVETIVTPATRSYFLNEVDGLENNDGILLVASTNFLDKLDPGLSKRPSRFDRKYLFPLPNEHERTLYCQYWRNKLKDKPTIDFPEKLCPAMAHVTNGFSFAFMQECFVATLLILASGHEDVMKGDKDELVDYELWVTFKEQADILRKEIYGQSVKPSQLMEWCKSGERQEQDMYATLTWPDNVALSPNNEAKHGLDRLTPALQGLSVRNEQLPELPWPARKTLHVNPAALEKRL